MMFVSVILPGMTVDSRVVCVQDKKLPTEELVAFLKTISVHRFCITTVSFLLRQMPGKEDSNNMLFCVCM